MFLAHKHQFYTGFSMFFAIVDNPSNGFEGWFSENAYLPTDLTCFFTDAHTSQSFSHVCLGPKDMWKWQGGVNIRKKDMSNLLEGMLILKIDFQIHWKGCQLWQQLSIFPSLFLCLIFKFSYFPIVFLCIFKNLSILQHFQWS